MRQGVAGVAVHAFCFAGTVGICCAPDHGPPKLLLLLECGTAQGTCTSCNLQRNGIAAHMLPGDISAVGAKRANDNDES